MGATVRRAASIVLATRALGLAAQDSAPPLTLGADLIPRPNVDLFNHPQGLVVLDERLCIPAGHDAVGGGEDKAEFNVSVEFFAGDALGPDGPGFFRLQTYRPFSAESSEDVREGYLLLASEDVHAAAAGGLVRRPLPWRWLPGDCLGWHSAVHGVVAFEEAGSEAAAVLLLLPGGDLVPGERLERRHFSGPVPRRYSVRLEVDRVPAIAVAPPAAAGCTAEVSEEHWALSSSAGSKLLPASDGEWSRGNGQLCRARGLHFFAGRFSFLGEQQPLLFGLCAPRGCTVREVSEVLGPELLERLAPGAAATALRRTDAQLWSALPDGSGRAEQLWLMVMLLPGCIGAICHIFGRAVSISPAKVVAQLHKGRVEHFEEAQVVRVVCTALGVMHELLGLDIFCAPGSPIWLWSDLDTAFGYLSSQALLLLSARLFLSPAPPTPAAALLRLARKWLRVAPLGLCLRLLACHPRLQPARPWGSAAPPRLGGAFSLGVDCAAPRCTSASSCVQPLPGLPFGIGDVAVGFPEIADVGWFLEADFAHTAVLALLCALRGLPGGRAVSALLVSGWVLALAGQWLRALPRARSLFDCMPLGLDPLTIPYFCLNHAMAPLVAWLFSLAPQRWRTPRMPGGVGLLAIGASVVPWLLDCAMMRRLGLPSGCYTGSRGSEEPTEEVMAEAWALRRQQLLAAWNVLRMVSLLAFQLTLLVLLQRRQPARAGVLASVDRLAFGLTVATPGLIRLVFFGSHTACLEFTPFALLANLLGVSLSGLLISLALHGLVQGPWERIVVGAVAAVSRRACTSRSLHSD